jgi:hypothetical protein
MALASISAHKPDVAETIPADVDYDAIHATLMASARGRWFLSEYAKRNRSADTLTVLTAIDRLGATLRGEAPASSTPEYLHLSLMAMAGLIASVETDVTALAAGTETPAEGKPRIARLSATLRDLGDCVQVMLDSFNKPPAQVLAPAAPTQPVAAIVTTATPENTMPSAAEALAPLQALSQPELIALFS